MICTKKFSFLKFALKLYSTSGIKPAQTLNCISELMGKILEEGKLGISLSETPMGEIAPLRKIHFQHISQSQIRASNNILGNLELRQS